MRALAAILLLPGCVPTEPASLDCGADRWQHLVGASAAAVAEVRHDGEVRINRGALPAPDPARPDRLNIDIDHTGTITSVRCG